MPRGLPDAPGCHAVDVDRTRGPVSAQSQLPPRGQWLAPARRERAGKHRGQLRQRQPAQRVGAVDVDGHCERAVWRCITSASDGDHEPCHAQYMLMLTPP